tara:strand:- start:312 stop:542 length:231 start_codon:yes stop_codon:yes gene_type:complete
MSNFISLHNVEKIEKTTRIYSIKEGDKRDFSSVTLNITDEKGFETSITLFSDEPHKLKITKSKTTTGKSYTKIGVK